MAKIVNLGISDSEKGSLDRKIAFEPIGCSGTLVVMVPTNEGLIVAADSRSTVNGKICDNSFKIIEVIKPDRTVISVTGNAYFINPPSLEEPDLCLYISKAPRLLDIGKVVQEYLEAMAQEITPIVIRHLGRKCIEELQNFTKNYPKPIESFAGKHICNVVIGNYKHEEEKSLIINFKLYIQPQTLNAEITDLEYTEFLPSSNMDIRSFGETEYVNEKVYKYGKQWLNKYKQFIENQCNVSEVTKHDAMEAAINLIEATSLTSDIIPAPSGIGGAVDVVFLGKERQPVRLRWKKD